jgi:hypothetical protein
VLGYGALEVGLAFLPANLIMAAFSLGLSAKLVMRWGTRAPLAIGLLLSAAGLALFARAPVDGGFDADVLPSMTLLGIGAGMAFNPMLLVAMSDVEPSESGLASGVVNTSFMMGGALGLAVLASAAVARSGDLSPPATGGGAPSGDTTSPSRGSPRKPPRLQCSARRSWGRRDAGSRGRGRAAHRRSRAEAGRPGAVP